MKARHPYIRPVLAGSVAVLFALAFSSCETYDYAEEATVYTVGQTYDEIPTPYRTVVYDDEAYYYADKTFFQRRGDRYKAVESPFKFVTDYDHGVYYDDLPYGYEAVRYRNRDYYYAEGRFYRPRGIRFVTVTDPFG